MTLRIPATTCAMTWCSRWVSALSNDGVGPGEVESGDGVELVHAMTSGEKAERALDDPGVEGAGVLP